jgi:hypothetical protein
VLSKLISYYEDTTSTADRLRKKNGMQEQEMSVAAYQYAAHNHEDLQLKYLSVLHLHSNTTNYFKPLDQHTIHSAKCAYHKYMVCYYLRLIVRNIAITEIMEQNTMQ